MTRKSVDAYGEELWGIYKGETDFEIVEREDGFISVGGHGKNYFFDYKDWPAIEKEGIKLVKGNVLDVGCGAGRHAIYLQKKGFNVLGIDNSPLAVKVSRLRGLKNAKILPIEKIDTLRQGSFDTILMLGNNFGLFGSAKKTKQLLRKMSKITSEDALIIAETRDPYDTGNKDHLSYQKWNKQRGRMAGQLRLRIRYRKLIGPWFDYLLTSRAEIKHLTEKTGWEIDRFIIFENSQYIVILRKSK